MNLQRKLELQAKHLRGLQKPQSSDSRLMWQWRYRVKGPRRKAPTNEQLCGVLFYAQAAAPAFAIDARWYYGA